MRGDVVYLAFHRAFLGTRRRETRLDRALGRWWNRADVAVYRRFGWSMAGRLLGVDVVLLETVGRRTGRPRESLVTTTDVDGQLVVAGGNSGWDRDPGWFHNLSADAGVHVTRAGHRAPMRAVVLAGDEAARARAAMVRASPHTAAYVRRRTRPIPVVRLDPLSLPGPSVGP